MIEEIFPDLYRIELPLPRNPLKAINSYLIKGDGGRSLIIDTGMNREECINVMEPSLKKLNVNLERTDYFITHVHADHMGLVSTLATEKSKVYFNRVEERILNNKQRWADLTDFYISNGFPEEELKRSLASHPARVFGPKRLVPFTVLQDGDSLEIGNYKFLCIETPGHSPCHICLYEKNKKILFSGDHVLIDITPNINYWPELKNSLKWYLQSLDKVFPLDVSLVLPGHRKMWNDNKARIKQLHEHHKFRLKEALNALQGGEKMAYEVAPHITWQIEYRSWETFPATQKWFAVGETIAHLEYLLGEGLVRKRTAAGNILYSLMHAS